jgi:hypothetical protein
MTRGESLLTVNPLFYEALSGEFLPVGSETSHTIGRSDHALLRHIILMREDESLRIADESYFRAKQTVKLVRNGNATTLPANLGSEVLSARNAITQAAQEFFA